MGKPQAQQIAALYRQATVVPSTINVEERTVEYTWTTGARVLRGGFFTEPFFEELSLDPSHVRMGRLESGTAPVLDAHMAWSNEDQLGVVESARLLRNEGRARVRYASAEANPKAGRIFRMVQEGISRNISVGYRVYRFEESERKVDGLPVRVAVDWEPFELSPVPIGADPGAQTRAPTHDLYTCEFIRREESMDPEETNPSPVTPTAPSTPAGPTADEIREIRAAEKTRAMDIRAAGRALGMDDAAIDKAIADDVSADDFRRSAIEAFGRKKPAIPDTGRPSVEAGATSDEKFHSAARDWLIIKAGMEGLFREAAAKRGETMARLDPGACQGRRLDRLAATCLSRKGVNVGNLTEDQIYRRAFTQGESMPHYRIGGYQSTGDFPVLLQEFLHKTLLNAYEIEPDVWRFICGTASVSDFRDHHLYRPGAIGVLKRVNEHGEYENVALPDGERQAHSADEYGQIISVTRKLLINDDLGQIANIAAQQGRAAALTQELAFFSLLAENGGLGPLMSDGNPLYHASHKNVGAGQALSRDAFEQDRLLMRRQRDPNNKEYVGAFPARLLIPDSLRALARKINLAANDPDDFNTAGNENNPNVNRGQYGDNNEGIIDTPRLEGTRRYVFAGPTMPAIVFSFLNGQQAPMFETMDGWRTSGTEFRVSLDFGVDAIDFRTTMTDAGA